MSKQFSPQIQDFNKARASFMERASDPHILPHAFKLAWLLCYRYMNRESGTAHPAQDTLARDLNISIRTVQRLLDILRPLGLGIAPGDGRGKASTYWLDPVTARGTERATSMSSFPAQKGDKKGRHPTTKKGDTHVAPTLLKRTKKSLLGELKLPPTDGERERAARADDSLLGGHPPRLTRGARQESLPLAATPNARTESKRTREEEITERAEINPPAVIAGRDFGDDWRELRALWQRGNPSDDNPKEVAIARAAHKRACERAEHSEIMAGARAWVEAKKAGDGVWFLTPLAKWLDGDGWTKPPPSKPKRQRAGNGNGRSRHHDNLPRSNGNKVDGTRVAFQMAGYVEDEDGRLVHPDGDEGSSFDFRASL